MLAPCLAILLGTGMQCNAERSVDVAALERAAQESPSEVVHRRVDAALATLNAEQGALLSAVRNKGRFVARSPSGNSVAWLDGRHLFYWFDERFERLSLPAGALAFGLSHRARFAAVVFREGEVCLTRRLDFTEKKILPGGTRSDCAGVPSISDDGRWVLVSYQSTLFRVPQHAQALYAPTAAERVAGPFAPKFKRVAPAVRAVQSGEDEAVIFVGAGGYYDVYAWQLGTKERLLLKGATKPELFAPLPPAMALFRGPDSPAATILPATTRLIGHVLVGGSGRLQLIELERGGSSPRVRQSIPVPYSTSYAFLPGAGLLVVEGGHPAVLRRGRRWPILLRRFFAFPEGLLYEDLEGRLLLRRTPVSPDEQRLLELRLRLSAHQAAGKP